MDAAYERLVEQLRQGNLIAFLGAGVSLPYHDVESGTQYGGLVSASKLVFEMAKTRSYIDENMPFHEACFLYKQHEGRSGLELFLSSHLDRPTLKPLPAHYLLSALPFASVITTNYDTLVETALRNTKKQPWPIFLDQHVAGLRPNHCPVIKLHGCLTNLSTIVASADEYTPFGSSKPIIDALLTVQLANRTALFMGYGLKDHDFVTTFRTVKDHLGDHMPRSFAVVYSTTDFERTFWKSLGVEIIVADLTQFLRGLVEKNGASTLPSVWLQAEDWTNSVFFTSLQSIRTLPSETQVVDAFLQHFLERLQAPGFATSSVVSEARGAVDAVRSAKPNYSAFFIVAKAAIDAVESVSPNKADAETALQDLIHKRSVIGQAIRHEGRKAISRHDTLLLYSQSKRVIELLQGVPKNVQASCQVFVAECRPKSPGAFSDALAIVDSLRDTTYEFTLIPDAAIGFSLESRQISKVMIGAHQVFKRDDVIEGVVNTCGSATVIHLAERLGIPVYIVAEKAKITELAPSEQLPVPSYIPEEALFGPVDAFFTEIKSKGRQIQGVNVGYDLCRFSVQPILITER